MSPLADVLICLRFFSRLPVPATRREIELGAQGFAAAAAMAPVAGVIIALVPAVVLAASIMAGLPAIVAASISMAVLTLATGALHEDALADCCDGFGGGRSRADKLLIMRDSRIGAFGAASIAFDILIGATALAAAVGQGVGRGVIALLVAAALSRAACLVPLLLPPARLDGVGHAAAPIGRSRVVLAVGLAGAITLAFALWPGSRVGGGTAVAAIIMAMGSGSAMAALAWRQIGGQTGDVAGATQQIVETAVLVVFASTVR